MDIHISKYSGKIKALNIRRASAWINAVSTTFLIGVINGVERREEPSSHTSALVRYWLNSALQLVGDPSPCFRSKRVSAFDQT